MDSIHGPNNGPIDRSRALEAAARARTVLHDEALHRVLSSGNGHEIPVPRQIFVNRNLHFSRVELVGFDMDYTLAIYHLRRLEELSYQMTIERLVTAKNYPPEIRGIPYDHAFVMRGLFIDKKHGNLLKIDRFGHVGRAYHGRPELPDEVLQTLYRYERIRLKNPEYAWI
ncbi:MAG: 5'-nucleotidase domain-containing protein, partial [Myxococcales bacterium]|nr:5'-nucleotidase domain-containing protein [Myxococcales bacterium]